MHAQCLEYERDQHPHGVAHMALAGEARSDPVAQGAALRHAAPDIGQGAAAHQGIVALAEHEKDIGGVEPRFLLIALDAAAEGAAREFILGPDGFPFGEEFAAFAAQRRPGGIIGDARIAQIDILALDHGLLAARKSEPTHKRHWPRLHHSAAFALRGAKRAANLAWLSSLPTGPTAAMEGEAMEKAA